MARELATGQRAAAEDRVKGRSPTISPSGFRPVAPAGVQVDPVARIAGDVVLRRLAAEDLRAFQAKGKGHAAAVEVRQARGRIDAEAGRLLIVERTQAGVLAPAPLQLDAPAE